MFTSSTGQFGIWCIDYAWGGAVTAEAYYNGTLLTTQAEIIYANIWTTLMPVKPDIEIVVKEPSKTDTNLSEVIQEINDIDQRLEGNEEIEDLPQYHGSMKY